MRSVKLPAALLAAALAGAAPAHEGGAHARGTVKEIAADHIVVAVPGGADVRVALLPGTQVLRGREPVPVSDVRAGERVVVHAVRRDGKLEATEVMVPKKAG